jgi:predicted MFS family arabinose efflux permease
MLEQALALQWIIAFFSPLAGPLIDSGRRRVMLGSLALLAIGASLAAIGQGYGVIVMAILLGNAGKTLYDPSMQAYVGDHVPYARRAMALGFTELAWSGSLVTFGPLSAYLIERVSLQAIYAVIAVGAVISGIILSIYLPPEYRRDAGEPAVGPRQNPLRSLRQRFGLVTSHRTALTIIISITLIAFAFDLLMIIYESWLITTFGMSTLTIGTLAFVFAFAELAGEVVIIGFADRFGKRRIAIVSAVATAIAYLVLQATVGNAILALAVLFVLFLAFEVSTISLVPLATEVLPQARGVMLTSLWTGISTGRLLGTLIGGPLYRAAGFSANMGLAAGLASVAAVLIVLFVQREGRAS